MKIFCKAVLMLAAIGVFSGVAMAQDPGNMDTVRVAKVNTNAGLKVGVPVTIYNDENVAGYSLGLKWNSVDVTCDSASYIGTRIPGPASKFLTINNPAKTVLVGMADFTSGNPLAPGSGLVFTLWFHVSGAAADQFVDIDSTFVPPAGNFIVSPQAGGSLTPAFFKGQIKIGNPSLPSTIALNHSTFTFNAQAGGSNPTSQIEIITNTGGGTLSWTSSHTSTWLILNPTSGTAPSNVSVAANITGLLAGTYVDTAVISAAGATNSPQIFVVTLNLTIPPPTIHLSPDSFYFQCLQSGSNPSDQVLSITNTGLGTLNWTATEGATWLTLSSYGGTAPSNVNLTVDNTGLIAGVYKDSVVVSDPNAINSPRRAKVVFEIFSAFPVIGHSPDSVFAVASETQNPYSRVFQIKNNGGGVMNWHVTKLRPWLSFDHDTGSAVNGSPGNVTLSFNRNLVPDFGLYYDTITISSTNASNSPVKVPVTMWKMESPQDLTVNTNTLNYVSVECGSLTGIPTQTFHINHAVEAPLLNWTSTHTQPWLTYSPTFGADTATVLVSVSVTGLTPGVYKDTIIVASPVSISPPQKIVVTFTVNATSGTPTLKLTQDSLFYIFAYTSVGFSDQMVTVYNLPGGCLDWAASTDQPWLTTVPTSGSTTENIVVKGDGVGLSLGNHTGEVTFTSSTAVNSPVHLPVSLWVYTFGDANGDGIVNISDVVYIIDYIFHGGPTPVPIFITGDVNCDRFTNVSDCVIIIDWIFNGGPAPCAY